MQCGYLIVEILALLVEAPPTAGGDFHDRCGRNLTGFRQIGREFEQVQRPSCVAVRRLCHQLQRLVIDFQSSGKSTRLVAQCTPQHGDQIVYGQRFQDIDARSRQKRVVQFKRRIFGGCADKGQRAVLDKRQKCILLRLVEAMHFVEKQHGAAITHVPMSLGLRYRLADILDAGHDG